MFQKLGNKRQSLSNCSSSNVISEGPLMPEIEELRSLLEKGDISTLFSQDEPKDCPRLSSSLVTLPTYITSQVIFHSDHRNIFLEFYTL